MFNETAYNGLGGLGEVTLTPSQQQIAARIVEVGHARGESEKHIQAALATGWVESRYRNLTTAVDHDSLGVFQQRPSQGWGSPQEVTDLDYAINAFYDAADQVNDTNMDFGQLAQAVQRSAFPARYGQAAGIVNQILAALGISSPGGAGDDSGGSDGSPLPADVITSPVDFFSGAPAWLPIVGIAAAAYLIMK